MDHPKRKYILKDFLEYKIIIVLIYPSRKRERESERVVKEDEKKIYELNNCI